MQKLGLNEIREKYLSFFESHEHLRHPSFSLVPEGDASLLLINSGMAPLKPYFSGEAQPPAKRMTSCQKCVRVIDIERVGKTDRHCTFFEMLGHFSFGDYFKREAIAWTWEFFTKVMGIDPNLLYCSVYLDDDEAWDIWTKEVGVDPSHMVRMGKDDNFWDIGSGPCGPCSEIYFDRGVENGCGKPDCKVGCDCDRFVEVGNNVFTQFNNDGAGNYTPLAQKNIDFGMGLERLACVVQGVDNVFEVDTITRIRQRVSEIAGIPYGQSEKTDMSLRVVTDHIRSTVMLICDGVQPSNEKRGYVLRRLLRRAARHGRLLGVMKPFLCDLAATVIEESGAAYPELRQRAEMIQKIIRIEEERFSKTIDAGLALLRDEIKKTDGQTFGGDPAFTLYDTFGFPIDLTLEILEEEGLSLDRARFDELMEEQRKRARAARAAMGDLSWVNLDLGIDRDIKTEFTGYHSWEESAVILAMLVDGKPVSTAYDGQTAVIVLNKTPFYAESGGQIADTGEIVGENGRFIVSDVQKSKDGKFLHVGIVESGEVSVGNAVTARIDSERRKGIMRAHSAAHLLQKALRNTLGTHVEQAGSWVGVDSLRFDFTHFSSISHEETIKINREINDMILEGLPVTMREMPMDEAKALGAMALFGEKYGDKVRVVSMGNYSLELCGGTHLDDTAKIGSFLFQNDTSIASGVRRIEAKVGRGLLDQLEGYSQMLFSIAGQFKTSPAELTEKVTGVISDMRSMNKEITRYKQLAAHQDAEKFLLSSQLISGLNVFTVVRSDVELEHMRMAGEYMKDKNPNVVAVLGLSSEDKLTFFAVCGKNAIEKGIKAGDLIRMVTKLCGGSGGGKPDSAMGGGKDVSKAEEAMAQVGQYILENIKN